MVKPKKVGSRTQAINGSTGIRVKNWKRKKNTYRLTHRQVWLILALLFLFMGSGIGYVWSNFEGTQIGYDLSRLKQKEMGLKEFNQKLRLELATLKSPQYIEEAIRGSGLQEASPTQIIVLP